MRIKNPKRARELPALNINELLTWTIVVIASSLLLFFGNRFAAGGLELFPETEPTIQRASVTEVLDREERVVDVNEYLTVTTITVLFQAEITHGDDRGLSITAEQFIDSNYATHDYLKEVEAGDKVTVFQNTESTSEISEWQFWDYYRFNQIVVLGIVFMALVLILGRWKGLNTLLSLILTFLFLFFVFVPAVMNGYNPYLAAALTSAYMIVMNLVLINGASRKTLATIIGCVMGTIIAAGITFFMSRSLRLTGFIDENSIYLTMLNPDRPIELTGIIFASILIGAMGAIMDVAMDISSSLNELHQHVPDVSFSAMFKSGMSIGRDIMGTMANTLILAYIGSSLSGIILLLTYSSSVLDLLNREVIIVELLQALIGSLAILITIPLTVMTCGFLYLRKRDVEQIERQLKH